jgi:predicted RecA/RadA family phage recombinase
MAEARDIRDFGIERIAILAGTLDPYQVLQMPSGKAGFYNSPTAAASGTPADLQTQGTVSIAKTTSMVLLAGGRVYWDHSANAVSYRKNADRDFYVGRVVEDATSAQTTCFVELNVDPRYDRDLLRDPNITVLAGTPAAGGFGYPVTLGGCAVLELTATNEAQKVDLLGVDGFAVAANAIVECAFRVISDGGAGAQDFSLGVANGTHATDFTTIAEFVSVHLDGDDTDIQIGSDDGTTDTAEIDSTIDYTEGAALANRAEVWFDLRNPADIQVYVNGALVLDASTFSLNAATGPLFLIAHLEKTATTDTYKVAVDWLRARFSEQ